MNRARAVAAIAAVLTALLLQATLIGPIAAPLPVSLPALLVAAIALVDGPGTGMAFGFAAGLLADLGSTHPAGVFALCWLGIGLVCGLCSKPHSLLLRDLITAAVVCAGASVVATLGLHAVGSTAGASLDVAMRQGILACFGDAALALIVLPLVRTMLRHDALRAPRPVLVIEGEQW